MIAKRWMADRDAVRVLAIFPAETCKRIRTGFHLPEGLELRRAISPKVIANIDRYAHRSMKKGELSQTAGNYLLDWCHGRLAPLPRPQNYSILDYRIEELRGELSRHGTWPKPARTRHIDLTIGGLEAADESQDSGSEGEVALPAALADS